MFFLEIFFFFCSNFLKFAYQFPISFVQISDSQLAPEGAACRTFCDFSGRPAFVPTFQIWKTTATVYKTKNIRFGFFFGGKSPVFFWRDSQIFLSRFADFFAAFPRLFSWIFNGFGCFCVQCSARRAPNAARRGGSMVALPFAFW